MKTRLRFLTLLLPLSMLLSGCFVNLKSHISREVKVEISGVVPVTVSNTGNSNFTTYMNQEQYVEAYLKGLKGELGGTENVILVESGGEFVISFDQVMITETTKIEKIDDTNSEDHGKEFELTTLNLSATGKVTRVSDGSTRSWSAYKDKSESTTSSRSAGQVITGDNKDKTEYREKTFDSGTAEDLTEKTGRRSGVVVVRDIGKLVK
ncbi:MAG: hypothetical protein ACFHU9_11020 [Fluviicola sp.]